MRTKNLLRNGFLIPRIAAALTLALAGAPAFGAGDPCIAPGVSVTSDPAGDATPAGASPQQDIVEVFIAEPAQADGVPKLLTTVKVVSLDLAALPPNANWRTYFKVGAETYFTTVVNDPTSGLRYEYGMIDPITGSNSTLGPADAGSVSGADKTLSVLIGTSKVGGPAPGSSLLNIYGRTQTLIGAAGTGGLITHDTAPNSGATSAASYTLLTAGNACVAPGGTPTPTPAPNPAAGTPRYHNFPASPGMGNNAGEPTLGPGKLNLAGQPPSSGGPTMYIAGLETLRASWDDCVSPAGALWERKTPPTTPPTTLDPILFTDFGAGRFSPARTFVSQLGPKTSFLTYSDDNGQSYLQSQGSGINSGVDHQTIGGGPYRTNATPPPPPNLLYQNAIYYASQDAAVAQMARSDDGGQTFGAAVPMYNLTQCGGLHGHIKVAPDGTVYVPNKNCGGTQAVVVSENNGVTFSVRPIPGSTAGDTDPSVGIDANGKLYFAFQNGNGRPMVAVSGDRGLTWSQPMDVGTRFGLKNCVFPTAVGGSADRGAVQFLATDEPGNYEASLVFKGVWHIYASHTFDGGTTWETVRVTPENDPAQRGSICTSGTGCLTNSVGGADRNLLDFNDLEIDHEGRLLVGFADGCVGCTSPVGADSRSAKATIARQSGGKRMLAQFDPVAPAAPAAPALGGGLNGDSTAVILHWSVPDPGDAPITAYNLYRREGAAGTRMLLATLTDTTYTDTTFNPAIENFYSVTAVNSVGEGPFCRELRPEVVIPQTPCVLPGVLVISDLNPDGTDNDAGANTPPDPRVNVRHLFIAEPDFAGAQKVVFTMELAPSTMTTAPPMSQWYIVWQRLNPDADFDRYYVAMKSDAASNVSFEYGKFGVPLAAGPDANPNANIPVKLGDADSGSYDPVNGVLTITLSNSKAENIGAGQKFAKINVRNYLTRPEPGPKAQNNASDISSDFDYTLVGNAFCRPNAAPIAALSANPTSGQAPLLVNFDASGSSDPDFNDLVASYTFSFGDGSAEVTQANPVIQHTYADSGNYLATVRVTDSRGKQSENPAQQVIIVSQPGPGPSPTPTATPTATPPPNVQLLNISGRVFAQSGDKVGIGGFIVTGTASKRVMARAIGPSLQHNGVPLPGRLQNPHLELRDNAGSPPIVNDNWRSTQEAEIQQSGLAPTHDDESAIVKRLPPGNYTAIIRGADGSAGVGLVELYDLSSTEPGELGNLSVRADVGTDDNVLIDGLILGGTTPKRVVFRALGPSLQVNGTPVTGALQNPTLDVYNANGTLLRANDNWPDAPNADEIQASGLAPADHRESAVLLTLTPGNYTSIVRGVNHTTGTGLAEAYKLNN